MTTTDPKADFSGVSAKLDTTAERKSEQKADFSGVSARSDSTAQTAGERQYTVEKGDTLSHIAKQFYGKASAWNTIFEANRDQIDDPDLIQPGQVLRIPAPETGD